MPVADGYYIDPSKYGPPAQGDVVYDPASDLSGDVLRTYRERPDGYSATSSFDVLWDGVASPETVGVDEREILRLSPRPIRR